MLVYVFVPGFYAEVERRRDATLAAAPVIVGGDPRKRGTVQAMTEDARLAGVQLGMPVVEALTHCPQARAVRTDMKRYREVDADLRARLRRETDRVEAAGLGAAYLDLVERDDPPEQFGPALRMAIQKEMGLPLCVGIAPMKFLAKIVAEEPEKQPVSWVAVSEVRRFLDPLPVVRLPGVGPRTASTLETLGVRTVADFVALGRAVIEEYLGNHGLTTLAYAMGQDAGRVRPAAHSRSLSQELTLDDPELDRGALEDHLTVLANGLELALARERLAARRLVLKVRYVEESQPMTRSRTLLRPVTGAGPIREVAFELLARTQAGSRPIRGLGLALQGLVRSRSDDRQLDLFGR